MTLPVMIVIAVLAAAVYGALSYYISFNGWVWLRTTRFGIYKKTYIGAAGFLSLSLIIGMFTPFLAFKLIGYFWLVLIGYGLILFPIINLIVRLLKKKGLFWIGLAVVAFYAFVFIYGSYNAWNPVVRQYEAAVDKPGKPGTLRVLAASDLHIGSIVGKNHAERLVRIADELKPDIILIPGDIIDDYIQPYLDQGVGETMKKLHAPLGVYAVPGNHDYYGDDLSRLSKEMEKAGITFLMDETVLVENEFYIVGRKDVTDENRKEVSELVKGLDHSKPILMMDHTPLFLDVAEENGIDLLFSGHTHRGQLAPAHWITAMMYENDWGHIEKGNMHSIVSSGFGTWGPPLRLGSRSEAVLVNVTFSGPN